MAPSHGEEGSSWRHQKRRRMDPRTFRRENVYGVGLQEFVAEVERERFGGEEENLRIHGDYGEEEYSEGIHDGLPDEELLPSLQNNYAEEEDDDQEEQNQEPGEQSQGEPGEGEEEAEENNGSVLVTLSDIDVLDCPVCCTALSVPVFQCGNGHVACASCCIELCNICAYCRYPLDNRSRVMERVIESVQAKCKNTKYGCKESVNYSKKHEHEKTCVYEPCSCPIADCNFVGSSSQLYKHFDIKHTDSAVRFSYNRLLHITAKADEKSYILQEKKCKALFILHNCVAEGFGNVLTVSCVQSKNDALLSDYYLEARDGCYCHYLRFRSSTSSTLKLDERPSATRYLLVPSHFFSYNGQFELDICIWRHGRSRNCLRERDLS